MIDVLRVSVMCPFIRNESDHYIYLGVGFYGSVFVGLIMDLFIHPCEPQVSSTVYFHW